LSSALQAALIHPVAPPPVPWWPPAPGWWLLFALILISLGLMPWLRSTLRRRTQRGQQAQRVLEQIPYQLNDQQWLSAINLQLKRLCKSKGHEAATRLYGSAWLDYLCQHYPRPQRGPLEPLASDLYRPAPDLSSQQRQALLRELRRWLRHNHV